MTNREQTMELSRTAAQERVDRIGAFQRELAELEREGVVTLDAAQRQAIERHQAGLLARYRQAYDIDHTRRERQLSLGMKIASFLGALALAASVFFLFYQFWGRFGSAAQAVILSGAALASFVATVYIAGRDTSGYFTKLAGLVAFACFVLDIAMLGQIFNLTPSDNALLAWAAFALLLAYGYEVRLLLVAGLLCLIAFFSARVGAWGGMYWVHFGARPENFLPVALLLFFLPQWLDQRRYGGFAATYRICGAICLFVPMLILSYWGQASYLDADPALIEGGYQLAGFALSAGLAWLGIRKNWGHAANAGVVFFVLFLYTKFFDWWWELMPKYLFFLVLGLAAVLCLLVLRRLRHAPSMTGGGA